MNRTLTITVVCLCIAFLPLVAAGTDNTYWQHDPSEPGDWFDPANWTAGLPSLSSRAYVDNGGTALISGYHGMRDLNVGFNHTGVVMQSSGFVHVSYWLRLGHEVGTHGTYVLADGLLIYSLALGIGVASGEGLFVQTGGEVMGLELHMGNHRYWYEGPPTGTGRYIQTGGINGVSRSMILGDPLETTSVPGQAFYELIGGRVDARSESLFGAGRFSQTGGVNAVDMLSIRGGRYEYLGGSLQIGHGLNCYGEFDFGGSSVSLSIDTGILNFGAASPLNAHNASISAGENSLVIFAEDFDPQTRLKHFESAGMVHTAGRDLLVPADTTIQGAGSVDDFVDCYGTIVAPHHLSIDLNNGLYMHEGAHVDLGSYGNLRVLDGRSGIDGGYLESGGLRLGAYGDPEPTSGLFRHSGGDVRLDNLWVYRSQYALSGGTLDTRKAQIWGGVLTQTGDTQAVFGTVEVSRGGSYLLHDGSVSANTVLVGDGGTFTVRGGSVTTNKLSFSLAGGMFFVDGGTVSADEITVTRGNLTLDDSQGSLSTRLLRVNNWGSVTVRKGSLDAEVVEVGHYFWGAGTLAILSSSPRIRVGRRLDFGPDSILTAAPGSRIRMTGEAPVDCEEPSAVIIESTDPAALAGLGNLRLIFEAGADTVTTFEVAGEDRGADLGGYFDNFALDTLQLGDGDVGRVQLVDWYDNQPGWEGAEALYVENLIIGPGSGLDLNGLKLYFLNGGQPTQLVEGDADLSGSVGLLDLTLLANNWGESACGWGEGDFTGDGSVNLLDLIILANNWEAGGSQAPVPEPAALGLIVAGACLPLLRRSRIGRGRAP